MATKIGSVAALKETPAKKRMQIARTIGAWIAKNQGREYLFIPARQKPNGRLMAKTNPAITQKL